MLSLRSQIVKSHLLPPRLSPALSIGHTVDVARVPADKSGDGASKRSTTTRDALAAWAPKLTDGKVTLKRTCDLWGYDDAGTAGLPRLIRLGGPTIHSVYYTQIRLAPRADLAHQTKGRDGKGAGCRVRPTFSRGGARVRTSAAGRSMRIARSSPHRGTPPSPPLEPTMPDQPPPETPTPASQSPLTCDGDAWSWRHRADFGPWLREQRQTHELTLKAAADRLGVTLTRLHKLETGGRVRAPSLELIAGIAALYGRELDDVLTRAGFRMEVPAELRDAARCDETFAALVLHPALRPACMDERWVSSWANLRGEHPATRRLEPRRQSRWREGAV